MMFFVTINSNLYAGETIPEALVISMVEVQGDSLIIHGYNFDKGSWPTPEVSLEGTPLTIIGTPTANMITADLSGFSNEDGYLLLELTTDTNLEDNDTHGLLWGEADPEPLWNQLHIPDN